MRARITCILIILHVGIYGVLSSDNKRFWGACKRGTWVRARTGLLCATACNNVWEKKKQKQISKRSRGPRRPRYRSILSRARGRPLAIFLFNLFYCYYYDFFFFLRVYCIYYCHPRSTGEPIKRPRGRARLVIIYCARARGEGDDTRPEINYNGRRIHIICVYTLPRVSDDHCYIRILRRVHII